MMGLVGFLVVMAVLEAAVLVHELAHLAAARALGVRVQRVIVGVGPRWAGVTVRVLGVPVSLRPVPLAGGAYVAGEEERRAGPWAMAAVAASGPCASVAAGVCVWWLLCGEAGLRFAGAVLGAVPRAVAGTVLSLLAWPPRHAVVPQVGGASAGALPGAVGVALMGGFVSLLLGALNALPVPPLDGGRVVLGVLEGCGVRVPRPVARAVAYGGLAAVFVLGVAPAFGSVWTASAALVGVWAAGRALGRAFPGLREWAARQAGLAGGG